ncbi:hypothetical protein Z945_1434 [Sulfitobacter noctilucae]|nr:hypothetical protein Z945_1434 [Sulfitobacter noctilucae]
MPGFDRFSAKFTETLSKRTGFQERSVTAFSGRRLDKELEAELLEAEFVDD